MSDEPSGLLGLLRAGVRECLAALAPRRVRAMDRGERAAARHLRRDGWDILAANVRYGRDEADLVARDARGVAVLLEVKSSRDALIAPERLVGGRKQAALRRLARRLAQERRFGFGGMAPRIDVVVVRLGAAETDDRVERHLHGAVGGGDGHRSQRQ